jgi:hypothetical protein
MIKNPVTKLSHCWGRLLFNSLPAPILVFVLISLGALVACSDKKPPAKNPANIKNPVVTPKPAPKDLITRTTADRKLSIGFLTPPSMSRLDAEFGGKPLKAIRWVANAVGDETPFVTFDFVILPANLDPKKVLELDVRPRFAAASHAKVTSLNFKGMATLMSTNSQVGGDPAISSIQYAMVSGQSLYMLAIVYGKNDASVANVNRIISSIELLEPNKPNK